MAEVKAGMDTSGTTNRTVIEVRDLTKVYRFGEVEVHALRGVSLKIQQSEFLAIMGPSGSGKSTFMNILGFLDQPTQGQYLLEGMSGARLSRDELAEIRNRKIGFVFQGFNLLPRTSALENVELPMIYARTSRTQRKDRAQKALSEILYLAPVAKGTQLNSTAKGRMPYGAEGSIKNLKFYDWQVLNAKRPEIVERWNKEIGRK